MSSTGVASTSRSRAPARAGAGRPHWSNRAPRWRVAARPAATRPRGLRLSCASRLGRALAHARPREAHLVRDYLARVVPGLAPAARASQVGELFGRFAALRRWVAGLAAVVARAPTQWLDFRDPWSVARAR